MCYENEDNQEYDFHYQKDIDWIYNLMPKYDYIYLLIYLNIYLCWYIYILYLINK